MQLKPREPIKSARYIDDVFVNQNIIIERGHVVSRICIFLGTALLFMILLLSINAPVVHPEASPNVVLPMTIATYGNAWTGNLTFGVSYTNSDVMFQGANRGYVVVMNTSNGYVEYSRQSDQGYGVVKNIGLNTVMFQGEPVIGGASTAPVSETHFWNFVTNTMVDFPNVNGHHDIEYNPVNNTFLTLNDYVRQVGDNYVLFDKIVLLRPDGQFTVELGHLRSHTAQRGRSFQHDLNNATE